MEQIKDIVKTVITGLSPNKRKSQEGIFEIWQDVLGNKAAKHTKIMGIKNAKLMVNVDSSVWLFQLHLRRSRLLKKLRGIMNGLEGINFRIGKVQ